MAREGFKINDYKNLIQSRDMLQSMLEKYILNRKDLGEISNTINDLVGGRITPIILKNLIINNRRNIINEMLLLFEFYQQLLKSNEDLNKNKNSEEEFQAVSSLKLELDKRNQLLTLAGFKLNNLLEKLRTKN